MTRRDQSPLESKYQSGLIKRLRIQFPGCLILKNDPGYQQGIPDLVIFFGGRYAFLEVKTEEPLTENDWQPNQQWFIAHINEMWYASVIYPENERAVRDDLQHALSPAGPTRVPEPEQVQLVELRRRKTRSSVRSITSRPKRNRASQAGA